MGEPDEKLPLLRSRSNTTDTTPGLALLIAVGLISAAILAFEVLLMRLYAIVGWHHFAYMMISIALLGFGASGTALTLLAGRLTRRFSIIFAGCAALFALWSIASVALALRLPFNPLAIVWEREQLLWLGLAYITLLPPFFFGASALGLTFTRFPQAIGRLYACDLIGAGLGALGVVGLLFVLTPEATLRCIAALGLAAAALALCAPGWAPRVGTLGLGAAAVLVALWLPPGWTALRPHISEYKGLPMALSAPDARIVDGAKTLNAATVAVGLLDIITDGEIRRESYSNRFATALDGVDIDNPGMALDRSGHPNPVPRVVGRIRRRHPVEVDDLLFLRRHTDRTVKMTVPGPFTMSQQAQIEHYGGSRELAAMDYAEAVNGEIRDLFAAGADIVQIDEPYMQARPDDARAYGLRALNRALEGVRGTTAVHICFGYAAIIHDRPAGYSFLPELADCSCVQVSIETAQSKLDCAVLARLEGKKIILGVIDLADPTVETPETVAARIRRALPYVAAENIVVAPDCGMKYLPRDVAFGKMRAMVEGARIAREQFES